MPAKRRHPDETPGACDDGLPAPVRATSLHPTKRPRLSPGPVPSQSDAHTWLPSLVPPLAGTDLLSPLSDELLVRILSLLSMDDLLAVAPVSRRFHRLSEDSQLWKALYYARFVLPRAMRIPGFRESHLGGVQPTDRSHKLQSSGRRSGELQTPNWKRQFKIRHNWSRGACAVEELRLGSEEGGIGRTKRSKILVKVVEGLAVTADMTWGLRTWDLKSRGLLSQASLPAAGGAAVPTCIAVDDLSLGSAGLDIAVGFADGGFGIWRFDRVGHRLVRRYRHEASTNGRLLDMSFSHPYLLTATESVLVSLYTFDVPAKTAGASRAEGHDPDGGSRRPKGDWSGDDQTGRPSSHSQEDPRQKSPPSALPAPLLLTSLRSHTSSPPLSLSIRRATSTTIASIAYTFRTLQGWSIGIQDLHIRPTTTRSGSRPEIQATKLAYTLPVSTGSSASSPPSPASASPSPRREVRRPVAGGVAMVRGGPLAQDGGPMTLCYSHPYLLATLPDNTLLLYLCTSTASTLSISPGIRLWGHTSGISDAEITARGKAVSVSSRGEEMRVWELEGRPSAVQSKSIEIRAGMSSWDARGAGGAAHNVAGGSVAEWDERRNWVGFDDEMVIVLKESPEGESLMVYDFT